MTEIFILRHGDAEQRSGSVAEADRQLTPKGKSDVERVVRLAFGKKLTPELILASPYRRALETAEIARGLLSGNPRLIEAPSLLPGAKPEETWKQLRSFAKTKQILLAGHEPHLSHLVVYLLGAPSLALDLKKGALVRISLPSMSPEPHGQLKWIVTPALARSTKTPRS
jgi:phosphohistidine phosphatase